MARLSARFLALLASLLALFSIGGAWFSELALGFVPCMLCLWERKPYYVALGIGIAALALWNFGASRRWIAHVAMKRKPVNRDTLQHALAGLLLILGLVFIVSFGLGAYHAGVEWKFWPAPDCGGSLKEVAPSLEDFRQSLNKARVVLCNEAPMRLLGLSFAGWNALVSALIAGLYLRAAWQVHGSSSESQ